MPEYPALFPGYNHEIITGANLQLFKTLIHSVIPDFSARTLGAVSPLQLSHEMRGHIIALNQPDIWRSVLKALTTENRISADSISKLNDGTVNKIALVATAGIIVGHTNFVDGSERTPMVRAILESLDQFPDPIRGFDELINRSAQVFGTVERQGTFGLALGSLDEPVLLGQEPFLDLFRIYGSDLAVRYFL